MIYSFSWSAFLVFAFFVAIVLGLSFFLGAKAKSAKGYYAAHGQIPWFINGVAFAGDYLSAASFLGICGMIAFYGYDGFLYSIGYLAGWIVALFVIAEPIKRMGKFTFADAMDARFNSRGIKLTVAISTLVVSIFYLIPQMVGAGALVKPLLGLEHWVGVLIVGVTVTLIVVTAGMVSTTWVQFIKGSLLVIFCAILAGLILHRGLVTSTSLRTAAANGPRNPEALDREPETGGWSGKPYVRLRDQEGRITAWHAPDPMKLTYSYSNPFPSTKPWPSAPVFEPMADIQSASRPIDLAMLRLGPTVQPTKNFSGYSECQLVTVTKAGVTLINGKRQSIENDLFPVGTIASLPNRQLTTGPLGPISFVSTFMNSTITTWSKDTVKESDGSTSTVYYQVPHKGSDLLLPGASPTFAGVRSNSIWKKLDFLSLMLALFCGTASLPHILIRYYTVKDAAAARKSTVVGIAAIGFFYILTLYLGLGAMTSGALDATDSNMAAPLLAKSFSNLLFAIISAIAFTTVLGTVSGLIMAGAGAVAHDLLENVLKVPMNDHQKVLYGKIASVFLGAGAMVLGILFNKMNVTFLVGWAFNIAASANLPALVMLLFWKRTTSKGIAAAVTVGMVTSLGWILLSPQAFKDVYNLDPSRSIIPFSQPALVTIPLGFIVLIGVSLITKARIEQRGFEVVASANK